MLKKLLVCLMFLGATAGVIAPSVSRASDEFYEVKEVIAGRENYEYIRALMVMMNENRPLDEVNKVVFEVEKYTEIADTLNEVAKIFYADSPELKEMRRVCARTHLLLVSFYLYQKNYAGAQEHFRVAEETYPELYEDLELEIEVGAIRDKQERYIVRFEMNDVQKFKSRFESSVGTSQEFEVEVSEDLVASEVTGVKITSLNNLMADSASFRLLELANESIGKNLTDGKRFFRLTLAPGDYQITSEAGTIFAQKFTIGASGQEAFTLTIQPDQWFSLTYASNYKKSPPHLFYQGVEVQEESFDKMPYGEYEVKVDPKYYEFEYAKIRFTPNTEGDPISGADYVEIPVAPQGKYTLDLGKKGVFSRMGDRSVD